MTEFDWDRNVKHHDHDIEVRKTRHQWAHIDGIVITKSTGFVLHYDDDDMEQTSVAPDHFTYTYAEYKARVDLSETKPAPPDPDVSVLSMEMMKPDLWRHLREWHLGAYSYLASKATKEDIINWHTHIHDKGSWGYSSNPTYHNHKDIIVPTNMEPIAMTDPVNADEVLDSVKASGKPLNATQRKTLAEIIDGDFKNIRHQMEQFASDVKQDRKKEIEADFAVKDVVRQEFAVELSNLERKQADEQMDFHRRQAEEMAAFVRKAASVGISVEDTRDNQKVTKVAGLNEALKKSEAEVNTDLQRGLTLLEGQRLASQRTVLLASVTPEALDLLKTIPSAQELMEKAQLDRAAITAATNA